MSTKHTRGRRWLPLALVSICCRKRSKDKYRPHKFESTLYSNAHLSHNDSVQYIKSSDTVVADPPTANVEGKVLYNPGSDTVIYDNLIGESHLSLPVECAV